ncbi:IS110 family transposase [bacterium]|nr:IS110 family transposase [bacterium]
MTMLADQIEFVVGVDTHKHTHTAAIVDRLGGVSETLEFPADPSGYRGVLARMGACGGSRVWGVEGTGSYGAGLTGFLQEAGEHVVEVERPGRPLRRNGAKSDAIDAIRAARQVLASEHQIEPRQRGEREAVRVLLATRNGAVVARTKALNHLQALVVTAPPRIRTRLDGLSTTELARRASRLRLSADRPIEDQATIRAMRACARRAIACESEANELETELKRILTDQVPHLLAEPGVGPISAAAIYLAWSHPGRIRNDAAFAALAGVAPIPASSGQTTRHRLNRGGDRQLNRALHTITLSRLACHPETKAYATRRLTEGKTSREIRRCLKRHLARRIYKLLENTP